MLIVGDDPVFFGHDAGDIPVVFDTKGEVAAKWQVRRTPFVYVAIGGFIRAKGVANRYDQVVTLLDGHGAAGPREWSQPPTPSGPDGDPRERVEVAS